MEFFADILKEVSFQAFFIIFAMRLYSAEKKQTKVDADTFKVSSILFWDADFLLFILIGISIFIFIFFDTLTSDVVFQTIIMLFTLPMYMRRRKNIIDDADDVKMPATLWNSDALLFIVFALSALALVDIVFETFIIYDNTYITFIIMGCLGDWRLVLGIFCYIAFRENSTRQIRFDSQHRFNTRKIWHGELSLEYMVCIGLATVYCMYSMFFLVLVYFMSFIANKAKLDSFVELFNSEFELYASMILFALPALLVVLMIIVSVGIWRSAKTSERSRTWIVTAKIITLGLMAYIVFNMYRLSAVRWFY